MDVLKVTTRTGRTVTITEIDKFITSNAEIITGKADFSEIKSNQWGAIMTACGWYFFSTGKDFQHGHHFYFDGLRELATLYKYFCERYDFVPSIYDFEKLANVPQLDFDYWLSGGAEGQALRALLMKSRENGISNRLLDDKSAIGRIAVANKEFYWNTYGARNSEDTAPGLVSLDDLPLLEGE